jgi:hypothetical protein
LSSATEKKEKDSAETLRALRFAEKKSFHHPSRLRASKEDGVHRDETEEKRDDFVD